MEDFYSVFGCGLRYVDFEEAAGEGAVFLKMLTIFFIGRRAHAAELARLESRLEQIRRIHRAARGGTRANDGVNFIDEQDSAISLLQLNHHGFQALFKVAAIARTCEKRAHVEREYRRIGQHIWHIIIDNAAGNTFCNGGFTHARVAHEERVILAAAREHHDAALNLFITPD